MKVLSPEKWKAHRTHVLSEESGERIWTAGNATAGQLLPGCHPQQRKWLHFRKKHSAEFQSVAANATSDQLLMLLHALCKLFSPMFWFCSCVQPLVRSGLSQPASPDPQQKSPFTRKVCRHQQKMLMWGFLFRSLLSMSRQSDCRWFEVLMSLATVGRIVATVPLADSFCWTANRGTISIFGAINTSNLDQRGLCKRYRDELRGSVIYGLVSRAMGCLRANGE